MALGVWLIPWILDGRDPQPAPRAADPVTELPIDAAEVVPLRTRTINLDRRAGGSGFQPEAAQVAADIEAASPDEIVDDPVSVAGVAQPAPRAIEPITVSPGGREQAGGADAYAESAPTDLQGRRAASGANVRTVSDGWAVQLGSFRDRDNADRQAARVATYGFEPDVSEFATAGQSMYRVRVGPYASRDGADETASTLTANGFVAQVVAH